MSELTGFLLERIAEDEEQARIAVEDAHRFNPGTIDHHWHAGDVGGNSRYLEVTVGPHRALAECAAKRAIIVAAWDDHIKIESEWGAMRGQATLERDGDYPESLLALAAIYKDHPEFDTRWTP